MKGEGPRRMPGALVVGVRRRGLGSGSKKDVFSWARVDERRVLDIPGSGDRSNLKPWRGALQT